MTLKWNPRRSYIEWIHYMYIFCILYMSYLFFYSNYNWLRLLLKEFYRNWWIINIVKDKCIGVWVYFGEPFDWLKEWLIFPRTRELEKRPMKFIFDICFNYSIVRNSDWVFKYKELVSTRRLKYFTNNKYMTWQNDI